jgi:SAM-dependent methyltransferase
VPSPPDGSRLADLNQQWQTRHEPPPASDRSIKGRLRTFVWRLIGPSLEAQQTFNATLVDHLNRNAGPLEAAQRAISDLVALVRARQEARGRFEAHLIQYLQTITWYVDTKDRSTGGGAQVLNAALSALNDEWLRRWESLQAREARFSHHVEQLVQSVDDVRATSAIAQQTSLSLKRDLERFVATGPADTVPGRPLSPGVTPAAGEPADQPAASTIDDFHYVSFENAFRGSTEEIRARLAEYLPRFEGRSDILEIGCGRGEFLDLLREHGVSARGLDVNEAMVQETRARGLDAIRADALPYLQGLPDASLGGLFAAQVVEHLQPAYLARLIETAGHKLRPGGLIVLETINPTCWVAFFESYIRDLTHVRPLHPETLQFLVRAAGFRQVEVEYRAPVPEAEKLRTLPWHLPAGDATLQALVEHLNAQAAQLNRRLFGYQDYAVIGER